MVSSISFYLIRSHLVKNIIVNGQKPANWADYLPLFVSFKYCMSDYWLKMDDTKSFK